jgi:hypothetical protein
VACISKKAAGRSEVQAGFDMSEFKSSDDQSGELIYWSNERISEIETELLDEGNQSVVFVILLAFVLGLVLGGFATYAMADESEAWTFLMPIVEKAVILPLGR